MGNRSSDEAMKRYVVLSVNENLKYLYYLPLVRWAWKKYEWDVILLYARNEQTEQLKLIEELTDSPEYEPFKLKIIREFHGYKSETIAQVSRLYAACLDRLDDNCYLMTSDIDMLPLNAYYWHYEGHRFISFGRDLTDYHYPICYLAARKQLWKDLMYFNGDDINGYIKRDLDSMDKNTNAWLWDQDLITKRLLHYGKENINLINRGTDPRTGYPIGRVDRSNWRLDHKQLIDCHLPHDILTNDKSFHNVLNLLHHVWPKENWKWWIEYTNEFKKLL